MTRPGPLRRWDVLRPLDLLANTGVTAAYLSLFITVRRLIIGRRVTVRTEGGDLVFTVDELVSRLDVRSVSEGRLDDIRLVARDVRWNGHRFDRASAVLHGVHLRGTLPPVLVASSVDLVVDVPAPVIDEWLRSVAPRLSAGVDGDGVASVGWVRRGAAGRLEIEPRLDGTTLWLRPRAYLRRRRWALPARTPGRRVTIPELPHEITVTGVEVLPGGMRISGVLPRWRAEVPRRRLEDLVDQLTGAGRPLTLIWPARER